MVKSRFDVLVSALKELRSKRIKAVVLMRPDLFDQLPEGVSLTHFKVNKLDAWIQGYPVVPSPGIKVNWRISYQPKKAAPVAQRS